ncbi:MAG: hypothetical protein EOO05_09285 [Chitinophagaceae bacterium]|nr:MAG: hypothetical protein EOO05_09285 [Chitinophagaceae bacterium]
MQHKLSITEKLILGLVALIVAVGIYLFYTNLDAFIIYTEEDGSVEWLTVLGLLLGCAVCIERFIRLRKERSWWFLTVVILLGLLMFAAAGEEISWGQRILGIRSSEFFIENNAQGETNFHNLVVGGEKLNKIIFSIGLSIALGIYLVLFPILYRSKEGFRRFVDRSGIPVARLYQVISIGVLYGLTEIMRHGKRAEILEAGITLLFFIIVLYPSNKEIFRKKRLG